MSGGKIPIKEHSILKILMRTDYRFASDRSGYIVNIFFFEKAWERPDSFLLVEILYFLSMNRKQRGQIGLEGYFTCRKIADLLQQIGYVPDDVLAALNFLLKRRLVSADHMNHEAVGLEDAVHVLASGYMHLRVFTERIEYLYGILPTVPIADRLICEKITEVLEKEDSAGDVALSEKVYAVKLLEGYLRQQADSLRKRNVRGDESLLGGGASYVLGKISACIKHYYDWHSSDDLEQDALDAS